MCEEVKTNRLELDDRKLNESEKAEIKQGKKTTVTGVLSSEASWFLYKAFMVFHQPTNYDFSEQVSVSYL